MNRTAALFGVLLLTLLGPARAEVLVTLDRPEPYELQLRGFELSRAGEVEIEAVGRWDRAHDSFLERWFGDDDREDLLSVYAWILDAQTRRPVWVMTADETSRISTTLRGAEESIRLEEGRYELYLFSGYDWLESFERDSASRENDDRWWERLWSGPRFDPAAVRADLGDCRVSIASDDLTRHDVRSFEVTGELPGTLIRHARLGDSTFAVRGFELRKPMALRVYAMLEWTKGAEEAADYGWIIDEQTREVVWRGDRHAAQPAGGGNKNWLADETIELSSGRYLLYYGTDDSHSHGAFTVNPPHDPLNWGITLLPGDGFDRDAFAIFSPEQPEAVIEIGRVGSGEFFEKPFGLAADGAVLVHALGEYIDHDDSFADSAWIVDARSGRTVWEMTRRNTMGAGGSEKNRRFDGWVELAQGQYVLYYVTDGSHAYGDWNAATPFEPEAWGVSLRSGPGAEAGLFPMDVAELEVAADILVRLIRAGDDERLSRGFEVEASQRVRIYALGEGLSGRMYDYGYIVDEATGDTVWEMTYDRTYHAGGAEKNRMAEEELTLAPGTYEAIYVTDDNHSFEGWNASRPDDPLSWGMTIRTLAR